MNEERRLAMTTEDLSKDPVKEICPQLMNEDDLVKKALASVGLATKEDKSPWRSEPMYSCDLTGRFLDALKQHGFRLTPRTDGVITLLDENPQSPMSGFIASNYWNFRDRDGERDKLSLSIGTVATISQKEGGVILMPSVVGTFLSPSDVLPQLRVFEVVAQFEANVHSVVRHIVDNKGKVTVSWDDIGLAGIRNLAEIFKEFKGGSEKLELLALSALSPFDPNPCAGFEESLYLPKPYQSALLGVWRTQLDQLKAIL